MSSGPVATATVRVIPDTTGFRALLEAEVAAATKGISASVSSGLTGTATSATAASTSLKKAGGAAKEAAAGAEVAKNESNALRGALIGLSRVTPVTVFGLGVYGTAAIAAGLAIKSAIKSTADLEHELFVFQATTGATADQMKRVQEEAIKLGGDLTLPATSAGDAAVAMTELAKAGLTVNETLAAARGTLQLAAAAQISVGQSADYVATELNAFNLSGTQATHIADLLAGASIAAQGSIVDFGTAFQQVSAVSHQVGLSVEDTTGALTELAKAGLKGADGGTSLRTTLLRLTPTTKQAAEYQKALGIQLDNSLPIGKQLGNVIDQYRRALTALTPIQQQQALAQIFGQDAIRAASILIRGGSRALAENTAAANQNGAAARLAAANSKGLSGAFAGLKNDLDTLGITLGLVAKGPLTTFVNQLASAASEAVFWGNTVVKQANRVEKALGESGFGSSKKGASQGGGISDLPGVHFFGSLPSQVGHARDAAENVLKLFLGSGAPDTGAAQLKEARTAVREFLAQQAATSRGEANLAREGDAANRIPALTAQQQAAFTVTLDALTKKEKQAERARVALLIARKKQQKANLDITAPLNLQNAQLNAQISGSLQAELSADQAVENYFANRLKSAVKGTARYTKILAAEASAHSATAAVQSQINANAKAARDAALAKAKQDAADAKAHAAALFNLEKSRLDLAIQAAGLTKGVADDIRANRAEIRFFQAQIARIEALKKRRKLTLDEKQALIDYQSAILSLRQTIQDAKKKNKQDKGNGFTLEDLFKESVNQLNEFGSNVSTGVTIGGGARAALAGAITAQNPHLSPADRAKLLATGKTNDLLAEILAAISENPSKNPPGKAPARVRDFGGPGVFATDARSRSFTSTIRGGPH